MTLTAGTRLRQPNAVVRVLRHERAGTAARCCMLVSATMLRLCCAVEGQTNPCPRKQFASKQKGIDHSLSLALHSTQRWVM